MCGILGGIGATSSRPRQGRRTQSYAVDLSGWKAANRGSAIRCRTFRKEGKEKVDVRLNKIHNWMKEMEGLPKTSRNIPRPENRILHVRQSLLERSERPSISCADNGDRSTRWTNQETWGCWWECVRSSRSMKMKMGEYPSDSRLYSRVLYLTVTKMRKFQIWARLIMQTWPENGELHFRHVTSAEVFEISAGYSLHSRYSPP
jgi:hypothetical protein